MIIRPHLRRLLALGLALAPAACASGGARASQSTPDASSVRSPASARRTDVLSEEEIQKAHIPNLYDLVSSLRPRWLQTRGVDSFQRPSEVQVYVGDTRMQGGPSVLRDLPTLGVTKIEFVDGITASSRWGLDHGAGAIVVSMSAQRRP